MDSKYKNEWKEFNHLYKELDKLYHELAVRAGLSDSAFYIMYAIAELGDGCLQRDISEQYFLCKQTINSSIQNLKSNGYISLQQGKGRDKHIYLTDTGQRLVKEQIFPVMEQECAVFSDMSPEESRELLRLMKMYIQIFRKKTEQIL